MSKTFDLSTINLSAGTHTITVKARASGYLDSPASNAVNYVVAEETTYKLSGTWVFNEQPYIDAYIEESVSFVAGGNYVCTGVSIDGDNEEILYDDNKTGLLVAYGYMSSVKANAWQYAGLRLITFDGEQTVSQEFYEWFMANAVKRPNVTNGLAYTLSSDGTYYTCTGIGTATDVAITIASEIDGIPVVSIGEYAFYSNSNLIGVVIPDSVTSIGDGAFNSCSNLAKIVIGDNVSSIGANAFYDCTGLSKIIIPKSVITVGTQILYGCNLTVYCKAESKPSGWKSSWHVGCSGSVIWGYTGE